MDCTWVHAGVPQHAPAPSAHLVLHFGNLAELPRVGVGCAHQGLQVLTAQEAQDAGMLPEPKGVNHWLG
jgi:hypothetical protein